MQQLIRFFCSQDKIFYQVLILLFQTEIQGIILRLLYSYNRTRTALQKQLFPVETFEFDLTGGMVLMTVSKGMMLLVF